MPSSRHYSRHYSRHHLVHHLLCVGCVPPKPSPQHDVAPLALCNVALARSGMSSQAAAQAKRRRGEDRSRNSRSNVLPDGAKRTSPLRPEPVQRTESDTADRRKPLLSGLGTRGGHNSYVTLNNAREILENHEGESAARVKKALSKLGHASLHEYQIATVSKLNPTYVPSLGTPPFAMHQRSTPAASGLASGQQTPANTGQDHSAETAELRAVITELRVQVEALQSELDKERQRSRDEFERGLNFNLKKGKKRRHTDSDS